MGNISSAGTPVRKARGAPTSGAVLALRLVSWALLRDSVRAGQEIVRFDIEAIRSAHLSPLSPIVLPQLDPGARLEKTSATEVRAGQDVLLTVDLPEVAQG